MKNLTHFTEKKVGRYNVIEGDKGGKLTLDSFSAKLIFTQRLESPAFQFEHQISWKVDASFCGNQSKIHSKSKH